MVYQNTEKDWSGTPRVKQSASVSALRCWRGIGAGNETRTRDFHLGKVVLYQLSYSRLDDQSNCPGTRNNIEVRVGVKR